MAAALGGDHGSVPDTERRTVSETAGESGAAAGPSSPDDTKEARRVSGRRFFVCVSGSANGCHHKWIKKFQDIGHHEKSSPENSDYLLVFCPIISRVGTDIGVALERVPGGKPIILVVLHHTFDSELVISESRRQVENPNVYLTVDCLFYENKFLSCPRNDAAWAEICKTLRVSQNGVWNVFQKWSWNPFKKRSK